MVWLLLSEELEEMRRLDSSPQAIAFIEAFWARRDPDSGVPGNRFAETFFRRTEAADQLYGEVGRRGSLTDRGRAFLLLGSPSHIKSASKPRLRPTARLPSGQRVQTTELTVETWRYRVEDLEPRLQQLLAEAGGLPPLVEFVWQTDIRMTEGDVLLELAARAAVQMSYWEDE